MQAEHDPLRVVLDTNVLISAIGFQGGTRRIWALAEERKFHLFVSPFILEELRRNLIAKAKLSEIATDLLIKEVRVHAEEVRPLVEIAAIQRKDSDNRILECAVEAKADVLVTGNMRDLRPLGAFRGIAILTPGEFLARHFPGQED